MSKKAGILLYLSFEAEGKRQVFEQYFPDRSIVDAKEEADPDTTDVEYAVVWQPAPGMLASVPGLKVIFSLGAGVDHLFHDTGLPDLPVVRFVDPDLTGRMVEYVVLQCLMHVRQQRHYDGFQRKRQWKELEQPAAHAFRVGILGFGHLGQACARGLLALGFQVNGWSRSGRAMDGVASFDGSGLDDFLAQTDILVCLLPYTAETRGLLNSGLFSRLARNGPFGAPVLINAGRGGSQIEDDIVAALEDGTLRGASLDVFQQEPLPADSRLWNFNNVVITPHAAAVSNADALVTYVKRQIEQFEADGSLENIVDLSRGY